jgi:wyosine [tRNA(Phe)-imidazoG37] synthetase (radical SAM superfamily)
MVVQSRVATTRLNLFTQHDRNWRDNRYVYPVISRRSRGLSIGVNLNPDKVCNFDCIYCCVDRTTMPGRVEVDPDVLTSELEHLLDLYASGRLWQEAPFDQTPPHLRRLNDIAFSGDGEPTSFLRFEEACKLAAAALQRRRLNDVKLVVITNATLFHQPRVLRALEYLDTVNGEIWAKLDAGTEPYYKLVERTTIPFRQILDNLLLAGRQRPIVIQSLFMQVHGEPPPPEEIDAYVDRLRELRDAGCQIKLVQVYTIARGTAEAYVAPLRDEQVDAIVARVREIGLECEGFYGPT